MEESTGITPLESLAFAMQSSKGVYALLVGSGVSRSAQVPTGWEVLLDLIRRVAALRGDSGQPDPVAWFKQQFGKDPDYGELLSALGRTPAERNLILRQYFEPTDEERHQGVKVPQRAHRAIAELVSRSYVRVILTTNFDRLIEAALEAAGVAPTVISTPHAVAGALPLAHAGCTVVKLHGDYLDLRIKNTPLELLRYDRRIDRFLARVLEDFGLIVSGWSCEWDTALRNAIERSTSRKFTTYWAARGKLSDRAKALVKLRQAELVKVADADSFFGSLLDKVTALEALRSRHPLSAEIAVASLKRHIVSPNGRILVRDLVLAEVESVCQAFRPEPEREDLASRDKMHGHAAYYEDATRVLCRLMAHGAFWGTDETREVWPTSLQRLATHPGTGRPRYGTLHTALYPALLSLYSGGVAAVAGKQFDNLHAFVCGAIREDYRGNHPLAYGLITEKVMDAQPVGQMIRPPLANKVYKTPVHDRIFEVIRDVLRDLIPNDDEYERCFDTFEFLNGLSYADLSERQNAGSWELPGGRWEWRSGAQGILQRVVEDARSLRQEWPLLKAGFFGRSTDRFETIWTQLSPIVARRRAR